MKMKSISRKTGMIVAVLALLVVMSAPTAMAVPPDTDTITAIWVHPNIVATASNFDHPDKWHQIRFYQSGTNYDENNPNAVGPYNTTNNPTGYFTSPEWKPDEEGGIAHTYSLDVVSLPGYEGEWTIWLFKAGVSAEPPEEGINSARVWAKVYVPIPEFTTIAIPAIALLGLFAFYRRKQKK